MQNYQNITLDVNNGIDFIYINAKQGDSNSRFLKIFLEESGKELVPESQCTAVLRCLKPDGRICINKAAVNDDGSITACLTEQVLAAAGTVRADVSLLKNDTVLSSATFFIQVEPSPAVKEGTLSSDEYLLLTETVEKANDAVNSIGETAETADKALALAKTLESNLMQTNNNVSKAAGRIDLLEKADTEIKKEINAVKEASDKAIERAETLEGYIGYTESDILGLQVDYENKQFTRLAGAAGKTAGAEFDEFPMYGGMRRCNVSDNGTIVAYYGDEGYADNGTNGQVMVYVPKFYYRVVPLKLDKISETGVGYHIRKANYYVCSTPKAGFKLHPAFVNENGEETEYFLYSAYEGVLWRAGAQTYYDDNAHTSTVINDNDMICSLSGKKPISGQNIAVTREKAELYCKNRGAGWHCETIKALSALKLLMMIEFGSLNTQSALNSGIVLIPHSDSLGVNYASITGSTSSFGNATGTAASTTNTGGGEVTNRTESGMVAVTYRGIENPWGNIWRFIAGINVWGNGAMAGGQPYIADDFNYNEIKHDGNYQSAGFTITNSNGYISAMGYGSEKYDWLLMPSQAEGTSALPVGDYWYRLEDISGHCILRHGGAWNYGTMAGMFTGTSNTSYLRQGTATGCRLIYIPTSA